MRGGERYAKMLACVCVCVCYRVAKFNEIPVLVVCVSHIYQQLGGFFEENDL